MSNNRQSNAHSKPQIQAQVISTRLICIELDRVRRGLIRYSKRASSVANDIAPKSASSARIRAAELNLIKTLASLEGKVIRADQ